MLIHVTEMIYVSFYLFLAAFISCHIELEGFEINTTHYYTHDETVSVLNYFAQTFPHLASVYSIGQSVQKRDLLVMKLSTEKSERTLLKPMVKFIGKIHGNEPVGGNLIIFLIDYLLKEYGTNPRILRLINSTELHFLPAVNPDGFSKAKEGDCVHADEDSGRSNANNFDLNRNFPDYFMQKDPNYESEPRQPEAAAIMKWVLENPFVLSACFHGGAIVASYPTDNCENKEHLSSKRCVSPDNAILEHLALTYSSKHELMDSETRCEYSDKVFQRGIVNGAEWYILVGGMQDFNYFFSNCLEITFELTCCKYPVGSELPREWELNREAMLAFIEQVHEGIKGVVLNNNSVAIPEATVKFGRNPRLTKTSQRGEFWRLLLPGSYTVIVRAKNYCSATKHKVLVKSGGPTILTFYLQPSPSLSSANFLSGVEIMYGIWFSIVIILSNLHKLIYFSD